MGEAGRLVVPVVLAADSTLTPSLNTLVTHRCPDAACALHHASVSVIIALGAFRRSWACAPRSGRGFGMDTFSFVTVRRCGYAWRGVPFAIVASWSHVKLARCLFCVRSAASRGGAVESDIRSSAANTLAKLREPGPDTGVRGRFTVDLMVVMLRTQI